MQTSYANLEIDKIMKDSKIEFPKNIALVCAWVAANFKGENLKLLDVGKIGPLTDYFLLVSVSNLGQMKAIADEICKQVKRLGYKIYSREGLDNSEWGLIDAGDVIVHIFQDHARPVYDLDQLWENAPILEIPESYYFGPGLVDTQKTEETSFVRGSEDYF